MPNYGVLALQGDWHAHGVVLSTLGVASRPVRTAVELDLVDGLIIPGGESSTMLRLMEPENLMSRISERIAAGMAILATCAGVILLAQRVEPLQISLDALAVDVVRNAYGRQVHSSVERVEVEPSLGPPSSMEAVFIRAPQITRVGRDVEVLGRLRDDPVIVRQDRILGATFHPELTNDTRVHELFLKLGRIEMAETLLRQEEHKGVHRLIMAHGANALDRPLMDAVRTALQDLANSGVPAIVLASGHPSLFCPGWDLKLLADAPREEVAVFLEEFNALVLELFRYPGPTAAEIGGHAVAAGCQIAIACDLRVMATGRPRLGLSELNLGVPVPGHSLRMLSSRLSSSAVDDLVFRGEGCTAERARELGLVHRAVAREELAAVTAHEITRLAGRPRRAFVETKRMLLSPSWAEMGHPESAEDDAFLDCWFEPETRARISGVSNRLRG